MTDESRVVLVSTCLVGLKTRYDGSACDDVVEVEEGARIVPVCPEQLGGLPTPRLASTIDGDSAEDVLAGRASIVNGAGEDVTEQFLHRSHVDATSQPLGGSKMTKIMESDPVETGRLLTLIKGISWIS